MTKVSGLDFDCQKAEGEITGFIRKTVVKSGANGTVVGLSGGIDSSVVGALCVKALGGQNTCGVLMPAFHTPEQDVKDARFLAKMWGIKSYEVGIDSIFSSIVDSIGSKDDNRITHANTKARIRMLILYFFANRFGFLVAGTGDRSEDILGYFTKYGDGGVDFLPISHLYKTQVRQLGAHLGLPDRVVNKPASPQLWPGHKATDELPLDYDQLDPLLHLLFDLKIPRRIAAAKAEVDIKVVNKIMRMYSNSGHKRSYPPMVRDW